MDGIRQNEYIKRIPTTVENVGSKELAFLALAMKILYVIPAAIIMEYSSTHVDNNFFYQLVDYLGKAAVYIILGDAIIETAICFLKVTGLFVVAVGCAFIKDVIVITMYIGTLIRESNTSHILISVFVTALVVIDAIFLYYLSLYLIPTRAKGEEEEV